VITIGGYSAWRVGGTLALAAAAFGILAAVRAWRAEEDAGRTEIVLAGVIGRGTAFSSSLAAIGLSVAVLWLAEFAGFAVAGLPAAGSAYLALATATVAGVFVAIGALASQLASTRRMALGLGAGALALFWLLRVLADTISGAGWVRWMTPLGWAEELRPFAGPRPLVLLLPIALIVPLLLVAARISSARDVGTGLIPAADSAPPSRFLLSSPTAQALRRQRGILAVWAMGLAVFGVVLGAVSTSVSTAGISENMQKQIEKLGAGSIISPTGYLSFVFIIFIFAVCLFVCSQIGAARQEESEQQLETLLAQPVSRYRWLGGRLLLAAGAAAVLSLLAGLFTWIGASSEGVHISLAKLLEAGANCMPVSLLFLGITALAYAVLPRASAAISYSLVSLAFVWYLVGTLGGAPRWLVDITPFQHIGLVPVQSFRVAAAVTMVAIGLVAALASLFVFRQRDLVGS
jgi:ABC-2 type transport system permease protein